MYLFARSGQTWREQAYVKASNTDVRDGFGAALALDKDILAVGAPAEASCATGINDDEQSNSCGDAAATGGDNGAGAVYLFLRTGETWAQQAYVKATNTGDDRFGVSVAVDGGTLAAGADLDTSCAKGVNGNQLNNDCIESGAVYVYSQSW